MAHRAGPACAQAALGGPLALLVVPKGNRLDQFLVLPAKMQAEGLIPLLSLPVPGMSPFVPRLPMVALWLLPCWSMKMGAPPSDATASTSSRQPCLWEDRAQPAAPVTSSATSLPAALVPTEAVCLTGTNFQHTIKPSTDKSPVPTMH